ncbi:MAG: DUF3180 domain-containing protein [Candidatus Nanopelagicales bacterium]|nr:DUF3180 domain-containing protein [Candidatus Nanopelagicales bacterium]
MRPTSIRMLLLVAVLAAAVGWVIADWIDGQGRLPTVPWLAVVVIWVVTGFVGAWALVARHRLRPDGPGRRPGTPRMAPLVAARTTALALAGSRTGAVVFGVYGGTALRLLEETAVAAGRERLLAAALASLGGLLLAVLSLWLERICRVREDPDEPNGARGEPRSGSAGTAGAAPGMPRTAA